MTRELMDSLEQETMDRAEAYQLIIKDLNKSLEIAKNALSKIKHISIDHNCEECGTFTSVRYELQPAVEALKELRGERAR